MAPSDFTEQQLALIADRARVWEVRRFCQVLPSVVEYTRGDDAGLTTKPSEPHGRYSGSEPDGALAALLRSLIHQLGADLAMISLLDDHTQYFISGASRPNVHDAKVTLESTRWYGCESVMHHGGLCERTITRQNHPNDMAIYEECDMTKNEKTINLPFVRGDIAKFRHYAGVPLNPYNGPNIGTVFFFSEEPSKNGLSAANRLFLCEIAIDITKHLQRSVEALEGKRVLRFNHGVASLLTIGSSEEVVSESGSPLLEAQHGKRPLISNQYSTDALRLYHKAASIICDTFEFDSVRIQEVDSSRNIINNNPSWNGSKILAQHLGPNAQNIEEPSEELMGRLLELFPRGGVFQVVSESGEVIAATNAINAATVGDYIVSTGLSKTFPNAEQIILMPLWDTYHERNTGAVLGFAYDQSRIYLGSTDLSSMSALCTTIMTQVRRLEVQAMEKIKADFLGSVSHEMRTPLHGILSSLELLADTPYNTYQHDLLDIARYSGSSLLSTIDHILSFSKISAEAYAPEDTISNVSDDRPAPQLILLRHQRATSASEPVAPEVIYVCEELIQREAQRLHRKKTVRPELFSRQHHSSSHQLQPTVLSPLPGFVHHPIIVFDTNVAWSCRLAASAGFETVFTNLLENALKFGELSGCVRIRLDMDEKSLKLSVTDAGKGISSDFVRRSLFDAFTQENPHVEGTGLGLSLVKRTATALGGNILVESDKSCGSTFTATFPLDRMILELSRKTLDLSSNSSVSSTGSPRLEMSLFTPRRWETGDIVRGRRCTGMMSASLTQVLSRWFSTTVVPWDAPSMHSRLLFVLHEDLEHVIQTYGDMLAHAKCIVFCPDDETSISSHTMLSQEVTRINGSVSISKLKDALASFFPNEVSPAGLDLSAEQASTTLEDQKVSPVVQKDPTEKLADDTSESIPPQSSSNLAIRSKREEDDNNDSARLETFLRSTSDPSDKATTPVPTDTQENNEKHPAQQQLAMEASFASPPDTATKEPKLLLVDDNAVNLKVLSMYARKCSKAAPTSVGGGQEAIEAFRASLADGKNASQPFDLIFLDLSMPEVSGFDVAKEIRETEVRLQCTSRTYICALTGLASAKDHNAAYAAGVNNYLVKPANLKDLQDVVEKWRRSSSTD